jgi:uncharacterized protein (TIGR02569 family)
MSPEALEWQGKVLGSLSSDAFRVAPPLRSRTGALIVEGWTAWPLLAGRHRRRWADILAVGEGFHDALGTVRRPTALLDARTDRWARADRIAWGELLAGDLALVPEVADLLAARSPVGAASQLVHGDLTGNVLFADGLPPAIIDFSPYWRPKPFASAVVAVDAVVWHGADLGMLSTIVDPREGTGALIGALLFRLLADPDPAAQARRFRPAIDYVLRISGP